MGKISTATEHIMAVAILSFFCGPLWRDQEHGERDVPPDFEVARTLGLNPMDPNRPLLRSLRLSARLAARGVAALHACAHRVRKRRNVGWTAAYSPRADPFVSSDAKSNFDEFSHLFEDLGPGGVVDTE